MSASCDHKWKMDCLWEASFPAKCIAVLATRLILVLAIMIGSVVFCLLQFAASPFYFIGFSLLISMVFVYLDMSLRVCVTHDATVKSNIKTANNSTSGRNQRSLQNADILAQVLHISGPLAGCALIIFSLCIGLQARDYAYVRQPIAANISVSEVANLTQYDLFSFYDGQVLTNYSTQIKVDTKDTNYLTVAPISTDGSIANIAAWAETYSSSSDLSPDWQLALRQARRTFGESGPPEEMHKAIKTAKEQFMLNTTAAADKTILIWVSTEE